MDTHSYDLVIVGAGSGNMLPDKAFARWRIAVVEASRFGGTCLNRGCIPSKMLVHTADVARTVREAGRFGVRAEWGGADWPAIRDRVFGRIDPLHDKAVAHRRAGGIDVYSAEARFTGPKTLRAGDDVLTADRFVLAAGSRPVIPPVPGLASVPYHTSDTIMRLGELPGSMVVPGQPRHARFPVVPSAVFASPQVATAGLTEQELQAQGRRYIAATRNYRDAAYGWALEDTTSFVKVLADPDTRLLLGAHIIGPQASVLIQPLLQAMCLGSTADQVAAGVLYIHPALTEVFEQALLEL